MSDLFHISKHLNEGVGKVQSEQHRVLMKDGDDRLKGRRYHFIFNAEKLNTVRQEELNILQKRQQRTSRAWGIKDYFRWFWMSPMKSPVGTSSTVGTTGPFGLNWRP